MPSPPPNPETDAQIEEEVGAHVSERMADMYDRRRVISPPLDPVEALRRELCVCARVRALGGATICKPCRMLSAALPRTREEDEERGRVAERGWWRDLLGNSAIYDAKETDECGCERVSLGDTVIDFRCPEHPRRIERARKVYTLDDLHEARREGAEAAEVEAVKAERERCLRLLKEHVEMNVACHYTAGYAEGDDLETAIERGDHGSE